MSIDSIAELIIRTLAGEGRSLRITHTRTGIVYEVCDDQGRVLRWDRAMPARPLAILLKLASWQNGADINQTPRQDRERRATLRRLDRELSKIHKAYRAELRRGAEDPKPETEGPESDAWPVT